MLPQKPSFDKPALSLEELAQELSARLLAGTPEEAFNLLKRVGYYRLKGYWYRFKTTDVFVELSSGKRKSRISIDIRTLENIYDFDRALRFMLLDAIERIEVAVRAAAVHESVKRFGVFGYLDTTNYAVSVDEATALIARIKEQISRASKSMLSVRSFYDRYADAFPPACIVGEVFDFGTTLKFFNSNPPDVKRAVAAQCGGFDHKILSSWLAALNDVRNACAHHNRVWDRCWAKVPRLPTVWSGVPLGNIRQTGTILALCNALLRPVAPGSRWKNRLFALFDDPRFASVPIGALGLPPAWRNHPVWEK